MTRQGLTGAPIAEHDCDVKKTLLCGELEGRRTLNGFSLCDEFDARFARADPYELTAGGFRDVDRQIEFLASHVRGDRCPDGNRLARGYFVGRPPCGADYLDRFETNRSI